MCNCDWCGEQVAEKHSAQMDGKTFHVGMFKDCRNEYLKHKQQDQQKKKKLGPEDRWGS